MEKSKGNCPICEKPLQPDDDVVVCPYCGAPYHRECYNQEGKCIFADKHKAGFEYKPEPVYRAVVPPSPGAAYHNAEQSEDPSVGGILCERCKTVNDASNIFCEECGAPLRATFKTRQDSDPPPFEGGGEESWMGGGEGFFGSPFAPPLDLTGEIDGIPKKEWATYIGPSTPFYIQRLTAQQARNSKLSFIFSAFCFSSIYFAFRKLWGWAALSLGLFLLLQLPASLNIFMEAGVIDLPGLPDATLATLITVAWYGEIVRRIIFCVVALYLYRKKGRRQILHLRAAYTDPDEFERALRKKGGISVAGAVVVAAIIIALLVVMVQLGGQALSDYLSSISLFGM